MLLLFESAKYEIDSLQPFLGERYYRPLGAGLGQIDYVGYYYHAPAAHSVLILPKVFLKEGKVWGMYTPQEFLALQLASNEAVRKEFQPNTKNEQGRKEFQRNEENEQARKEFQRNGKATFLFRFSVWLYQAIKIFKRRHSLLTDSADLQQIIEPEGQKQLSELEVINSLLHFQRDNPALFTFVKRYNTSQRHQVSWHRTVQKQTPVIQNGVPVYIETVNKRKAINADEELFVLFFSLLHYLNEAYGLKAEVSPLYERLPKREFEKLLEGQGTRRLKQIRGNYYTDKLRQLWQLLYAYFDRAQHAKTHQGMREVVLVRDFNIVFEDMVDALLTDAAQPLPKALKEHKDGKILDHIYEYSSLLSPEDSIYHIGDSKYYSDTSALSKESVYKQFTYARNVIQLNIDLLNEGNLAQPLHYRDPLTEGYNVTPNFFISALVNDSLDFSKADLRPRHDSLQTNTHFADRLFDRDTLVLQAYNINFLYVLASYVTQNRQETTHFRQSTKQQFRQRLLDHLKSRYVFLKLTPTDQSLEDFVSKHFRLLNGRMYRPTSFTGSILVALPKKQPNPKWLGTMNAEISEWLLS